MGAPARVCNKATSLLAVDYTGSCLFCGLCPGLPKSRARLWKLNLEVRNQERVPGWGAQETRVVQDPPGGGP